MRQFPLKKTTRDVLERGKNRDLLEGPKGRYGWGRHPYTTLTEFYYKIQTLVERILVVLTNYERENE